MVPVKTAISAHELQRKVQTMRESLRDTRRQSVLAARLAGEQCRVAEANVHNDAARTLEACADVLYQVEEHLHGR